MLHQIEMTVS